MNKKYLAIRGSRLDLNVNDQLKRACLRLACMCRFHSKEDAALLLEVFSSLPQELQNLLITELNTSGFDNKKGILVYYLPQLFINLLKTNSKPCKLSVNPGGVH